MRYFILVIGMAAIAGGVMIPSLNSPVDDFLVFGNAIQESQQLIPLNFIRGMLVLVGSSLILLTILKMFYLTHHSTSKPVTGLNKIVLKIILSIAAFGFAFVLTSPYSLIGMSFLVGMLWEANHTSFGHEFIADKNRLLWIDMLMSPPLLDGVILGLAAVSLAFTVYSLFKKGWRKVLNPQAVLWLWIIFYLSFLILRVNLRVPRFTLPVIPFLIILAMQLVSQFYGYIASKISRKYVPVLAVGIVLFIGGLEVPGAVDRIFDFRSTTINREEASMAVAAGEWLLKTYPPSTRIFYDDYSYIPPLFSNAYLSPWTGETISVLNRLNPDLVIVSQAIARRYSNPALASVYDAGEHNFMGKYEYYKRLESGNLGYYLVKDFDEIQIYAKRQ